MTATFTCASTPVAPGSRKFGMDILNQASGGTYGADFADLKSMKGSYQTLHLTWSSLEGTGSGSTSGPFTDPGNALQAFSNLANSDGIKLALTIRPVDATGKTVPSNLASTSRSAAETLAGTYGLSSEAFIEYLRTLGLHTSTGAPKQGYAIVKDELAKRGF